MKFKKTVGFFCLISCMSTILSSLVYAKKNSADATFTPPAETTTTKTLPPHLHEIIKIKALPDNHPKIRHIKRASYKVKYIKAHQQQITLDLTTLKTNLQTRQENRWDDTYAKTSPIKNFFKHVRDKMKNFSASMTPSSKKNQPTM